MECRTMTDAYDRGTSTCHKRASMEAITRRIFETSAISDADAIVIRTAHRQRLDDAGRAALREVAPEIVMEFRGEHNRKLSTRKEMQWGAKGSFSLVIAGSKDGLWFDHEIGRGGDIIEFITVERGCSF